MAEIFSGLEGFPAPKYEQFKNTDEWLKACERYVKLFKATIRNSYMPIDLQRRMSAEKFVKRKL